MRGLQNLQPISNQPAGLEFPYRVGRYRPGESPFSSPGSSIRGWDLILPGFGRTSTLSLGATLASRLVHGPQSITIQLVELGFPLRVGWYRYVGFSLLVLGLFNPGMRRYPPRVRPDLDVV